MEKEGALKHVNPEEIPNITVIESKLPKGYEVTVKGIVAGGVSHPYLVPREYSITTHQEENETTESHSYSIHDPQLVEYINITDQQRDARLRSHNSVRSGEVKIKSYYPVYRLRLRPITSSVSCANGKMIDDEGYEYRCYDIYLIQEIGAPIQPSAHLLLMGGFVADPKTQRMTFLAHKVHQFNTADTVDVKKLRLLSEKFTGKTITQRMSWWLDNFERYSGVVGRSNVATLSFLTYATPRYLVIDDISKRGWGVTAVIGDTTTGKSETIRRMSELAKAGQIITGEIASMAGLQATAIQTDKGEWTFEGGALVI